jgi:radical SAM superfamily enzyme YgiQ (UPF0313 family)
MPPLGILFLGAVLEKNGHDVEIVPSDVLRYTWNDIVKKIDDFKPDVVGVTTTSENRFESFKLAEIVKQTNPSIITMLGGPHISMAKEDTLKHRKDVDIVSIGEGENTIIELAEALETGTDLINVKGIYYRDKNGEIIFTGDRPRIENLDILPFPARHLIPMDKYNFYITTRDGKKRKAQNLMTSRGCPFNCYFCATPVNWGRKMRGHSPERVIEEIELLIDRYGAEFIWFYDDTLNYNKPRLHKIMDMILERKLNIKFANEFRIDVIDKPLLEKMKKAGLEQGFFGIEAGASRVRVDIVKKNFAIEKAFQFLEWSKELDFIPGPFFIFSHYTETWEEAQQTIEIMEKVKEINPQADISTAILHVYPGTPLEAIAKKEGIVPEDFSWSRREDMKKVHTLPAAQGEVPLFKHKLSWFQIADLVFRWSATSKKIISKSKIRTVLKSIRGVKDIFIYGIFFIQFVRYKIKSVFFKK